MADRLAELLRQRALISEHVAWLDREIGRLEGSPAPSTPLPGVKTDAPAARLDDGSRPFTVPEAPDAASAPLPPAGEPAPTEAAEAAAARLLDEYRPTSTGLKNDVRKGCALYFVAAFVLLALGVAALYFTIGSR